MSSRIFVVLFCLYLYVSAEHIRCPRSFLLKKLLKLGKFDNDQCGQQDYGSYNQQPSAYQDQYNSNYNQQESDGFFKKNFFKGMFKDNFKGFNSDFKGFDSSYPTYSNQKYNVPATESIYQNSNSNYDQPQLYQNQKYNIPSNDNIYVSPNNDYNQPNNYYDSGNNKNDYKQDTLEKNDYTQDTANEYTKPSEYKPDSGSNYEEQPLQPRQYYEPQPMSVVYQQYYIPVPSIPIIREIPCGYCQNYSTGPAPTNHNSPTAINYASPEPTHDIPASAYDNVPTSSYDDNSAVSYVPAQNNYEQKPVSYNVNVDFYTY